MKWGNVEYLYCLRIFGSIAWKSVGPQICRETRTIKHEGLSSKGKDVKRKKQTKTNKIKPVLTSRKLGIGND